MAEPLFKFLRDGGVGPFSGHRWPAPKGAQPGDWQAAPHPLEPCAHGIHVCRPGDLAYWMSDELYEVEVAGAQLEHRQKLVVERARLVARVDTWPDVADELARRCIWYVRDLAVRELELAQQPEAADLFDFDDYEHAASFAAATVATRGDLLPVAPARFLGFLADAVEYVTGASSPPRAATYAAQIAAYAADRATPDPERRLPPGRSPFEIERERQAAFLFERVRSTTAAS